MLSSSDEIMFLNKKFHKNFTYNVCNEKVLTSPSVYYLHKHSYLTEMVNEKIDALKTSGLIDYWISKYLDPKYYRVKQIARERAKLNFSTLLGAFQLLVSGTIVAFTTFVLELLFRRMELIHSRL